MIAMAIEGNPKKIAADISEGLIVINKPYLKRMTPADIKIISTNLTLLLRNLRTEIVPPEELEAFQRKNRRQQRINQALNTLRAHARTHRIPI